MNWIETPLETIATTEIIYFEPKFQETCKRICKVLKIDLFPDFEQGYYMTLIQGKWVKKKIDETQKIQKDLPAFNSKVILQLEQTPSNILFVYDNDNLFGIIHFTDYSNHLIYNALYQNFFKFETSLREFLSYEGITYADFEAYYDYKLKKKKDNYYSKKLKTLRSLKFKKECKNLANLQKLELRETLLFSISSFHNNSKNTGLPIRGIKEESISKLRNIIMHSVDFTGYTPEIPHSFPTFKNFFQWVLDFKQAYEEIKRLRQIQMNENLYNFNSSRLAQLEKMSEQDISRFFNALP